MKFNDIRRFAGTTPSELVDYFRDNLSGALRQLSICLRNLTLSDNFTGFRASDIVVPAATVVEIPNGMTDGTVPTHYLIVNQTGAGQIVRASTTWTKNYVYIENVHATEDATVSIQFLR